MRDGKSEILKFWFEETSPQEWFRRSEAFAAAIRERFLSLYETARNGGMEEWRRDADGALALVLLLDQVPRHVFRGMAEAFATDAQALAVAKEAVQKGFDQILEPVKRGFLYVPFQHSEVLADQEKSLALYTKMKHENPAGYMYGVRHYEAIAQFGRFPNRNAVLGRENTAEEQLWLVDFEQRGRLF